tara:strand:+ start:741 stop:1049 length:309 start_codon:yes stop_codon:yes gene_type:complete
MLRPSFQLRVKDKTYNIEPTFGIHDDIEKVLDKTLYNVCLDEEIFSISDLFSVYNVLPLGDLPEIHLKDWIGFNRSDANKQIADLIIFLLKPEKQEEDVKKN